MWTATAPRYSFGTWRKLRHNQCCLLPMDTSISLETDEHITRLDFPVLCGDIA
jgi:hypothetical protein